MRNSPQGVTRDGQQWDHPDAVQSNAQDQAGKTGIGNQQVATAPQDEQRSLVLRGKGDAGHDISGAARRHMH